MHKRVEIKGNVRVRADGKKLLAAREYIIIEEIMYEKKDVFTAMPQSKQP